MQTHPNTESLMSVREAAEMLGVSVSWLNKLRITGGGPGFVKMGRRVAYEPSALATWVSQRMKYSTSEYLT